VFALAEIRSKRDCIASHNQSGEMSDMRRRLPLLAEAVCLTLPNAAPREQHPGRGRVTRLHTALAQPPYGG